MEVFVDDKDIDTPAIVDTTEGISSEGNAAIDAKLAEVFGDAVTPAVEVEGKREEGEEKSEARARLDKQASREAKDELHEEGLVDEDGNPVVKDGEAEGEEKPEGKETPKGDKEVAEKSDEVDPLIRYVANQNGYSNDRIDRLFKADPELAQQVFGEMAESYTNLSRQYADAASPVAPGTQQSATPAQGTETPASKLDQLYATLDAFAEANGEEIVEKLLKPLRSEVIEPLRQLQAAAEYTQRQAIASEATSAFETLSKANGGIYGKGLEVSKLQVSAREKVVNLADAIRTGASAQGRPMSVTDAINRAHLVVNAEAAKSQTRREIVSKVQKRANQITAKPTQRRSPGQVGSRSDEAAADAYEKRAAELGLNLGEY